MTRRLSKFQRLLEDFEQNDGLLSALSMIFLFLAFYVFIAVYFF